MILRTTGFALVGCAAALGILFAGTQEQRAAKPELGYLELPLLAVPLVGNAEVRGLSFARLGIVGPKGAGIDPITVETFLADAFHQAALAQPGGIGSASRTVDPARLKAAIPVRLAQAGAPFEVTRIVVVQSEFRSHDKLRELADQGAGKR